MFSDFFLVGYMSILVVVVLMFIVEALEQSGVINGIGYTIMWNQI